jgi:hypothetical protein
MEVVGDRGKPLVWFDGVDAFCSSLNGILAGGPVWHLGRPGFIEGPTGNASTLCGPAVDQRRRIGWVFAG